MSLINLFTSTRLNLSLQQISVKVFTILHASKISVSYKSAGNVLTNGTCGLLYGLCIEYVGKFPTKVPEDFLHMSTTKLKLWSDLYCNEKSSGTLVGNFPTHFMQSPKQPTSAICRELWQETHAASSTCRKHASAYVGNMLPAHEGNMLLYTMSCIFIFLFSLEPVRTNYLK